MRPKGREQGRFVALSGFRKLAGPLGDVMSSSSWMEMEDLSLLCVNGFASASILGPMSPDGLI